jgi:hypothetical protein
MRERERERERWEIFLREREEGFSFITRRGALNI